MPDTVETPAAEPTAVERARSDMSEGRAPAIDDIAASMLVSKDVPDEDGGSPTNTNPSSEGKNPAPDDVFVSGDVDVAQGENNEDEDDNSDSPVAVEDELEQDEKPSADDPLDFDLFDTPQERAGSDDEGATLDTSKLGEDATFSVTVDGVEQTVSLGDLKQRYAGEGAIEKRLQETTEMRTAASEDYQRSRQLTERVLQEFGQALFRRTVPMPDMSLADIDAASYIKQKDMYEQEGAALQQAHSRLAGIMGELDANNEKATAQRRQTAAAELRKIMPVFNDPVKGPKVREAIVDAAQQLGFTKAEVSQAEDPRLFRLMALAARELKRQSGVKAGKVEEKVRTLSNKGTRNQTPKSAQSRNDQALKKKALQTGSVDDVAATMIMKPKKRRR